MAQMQKNASLALVLLDSGSLRKRSRRANLEHSIFRGSTGLISIVPGCPRERSRLISLARFPKVVQMHKILLTRFENRCDIPFGSSGIIRSPHNENKERSKERT